MASVHSAALATVVPRRSGTLICRPVEEPEMGKTPQ
jgi:hypothetical protein